LRPPVERSALLSVLDAAFRLAVRRTSQRPAAATNDLPVLLIEDDEDHAELTRLYMQRVAPHQQVRWVKSVDAALEVLREQDVKLVLADLSLPDAQGLDVVRRLRTHEPAVPIVVVSALLDDALALEVLRAGAEDCLAKDSLNTLALGRALDFATERGERVGELAERARSDALTRLANHVAFEQRLEQALSRARRLDSKVAVLFLDLDRFKQINDRLGHLAGDRLLCEIADRLRKLVRQQDVVTRS
jgi:PleD family two-component response regulator